MQDTLSACQEAWPVNCLSVHGTRLDVSSGVWCQRLKWRTSLGLVVLAAAMSATSVKYAMEPVHPEGSAPLGCAVCCCWQDWGWWVAWVGLQGLKKPLAAGLSGWCELEVVPSLIE